MVCVAFPWGARVLACCCSLKHQSSHVGVSTALCTYLLLTSISILYLHVPRVPQMIHYIK